MRGSMLIDHAQVRQSVCRRVRVKTSARENGCAPVVHPNHIVFIWLAWELNCILLVSERFEISLLARHGQSRSPAE